MIPLGVLLATYANGAPEGFSGQAELHASLKGPLKNRNQLQAHLEIPKLEARYQSLEVGLAQPLRADFANSVISLEPAEKFEAPVLPSAYREECRCPDLRRRL